MTSTIETEKIPTNETTVLNGSTNNNDTIPVNVSAKPIYAYPPIQLNQFQYQHQNQKRPFFNPKIAFNKKFNYFNSKYPYHQQKRKLVNKTNENNEEVVDTVEDEFTTPNLLVEKDNQNDELENKEQQDKTPMCLINELARYNKLKPQYVLQDETGPAHKKIFTVTLKLADAEEYTAQGGSIKKAQHAAAQLALDNTKYPMAPKRTNIGINPTLTPTVKLNALAKKYSFDVNYITINNQKTYFQSLDYKPFQYPHVSQFPFNRYQPLFTVKLTIHDQIFFAHGNTIQEAKHRAACQALQYLSQNKVQFKIPDTQTSTTISSQDDTKNDDVNKNDVSRVQEIVVKRGLNINYELISETGPSHSKKFITKCKVGDNLETHGEGASKKESKKNAASKMLVELDKLPALELPKERKRTIKKVENRTENGENPTKQQRTKNIIKAKKANPEYGKGSINPISRLIQVQQANKQPEPKYELLEEKLSFRNKREFIIKVTVGEESCTAIGPNKRAAKRNAAEKMLAQLGIHSQQIPLKPVLKKSPAVTNTSNMNNSNVEKHVKFVDVEDSLTSSLSNLSVNGHLSTNTDSPKTILQSKLLIQKPKNEQSQFTRTLYYTYMVAHELLTSHESKTADLLKMDKKKKLNLALGVNNDVVVQAEQEIALTSESSFKDKLVFLADLMSFQVNFHSLSKKDEGITSYVSMSIIPQPDRPLNGSGKTSIDSCNAASQCALKYLAEKYDELLEKNLKRSKRNDQCDLNSLSFNKQTSPPSTPTQQQPQLSTPNESSSSTTTGESDKNVESEQK